MEKGLKPLSQILIHYKQNLNKKQENSKGRPKEKIKNEKGTKRPAKAFQRKS
jgi:hypothetical protein